MSKVWFITGSSRGLGRSLTEAVLASGDLAAATARNPEQLKDLAEKYPDRVYPLRLDVTNKLQIMVAVDNTIKKFGRIDVLVNNAGFGIIGAAEAYSDEQVRSQLETNLYAPIEINRAVLPYMRKQRSGRILQISSIAAKVMIDLVDSPEPPVHLVLGSEAIGMVQQADVVKNEELEKWLAVSTSTDADGAEGGEFKSFSVYFDQPFLRNLSMETGYKMEKHMEDPAVIHLKPDPLYKNYFDSLPPYMLLNGEEDAGLVALKLREAALLLLKVNPGMKDILFDFSEPGKIDLEAFMSRNFHFNVDLNRFAYLTGRSLATFKRDFEKLFHLTPSRWLQQRRLQEAFYLIKEKGKTPSDIYLDLGFEDLSHFSFAFKKQFGAAPTKI